MSEFDEDGNLNDPSSIDTSSSNGRAAAPVLSRSEQLKADREKRKSAAKASAGSGSVENQLAAERAQWRAKKAQLNEILGEDNNNPVSDAQNNIIQHAASLQKQNQSTLANTLRVAHATNSLADETLQKLTSQTEQFIRIDQALDVTEASLSRSDRTIRGIKSFGGRVANYFSSPSEHKSKLFVRERGANSSNEVSNAVHHKMDRSSNISGHMYGSEFNGADKVTIAQTRLQQSGVNSLLPASQQTAQAVAAGNNSSVQTSVALGLDGSGYTGSEPVKVKRSLFSRKKPLPPPVTEPVRERIESTARELDAISAINSNTHTEDQALDELSDVMKLLHMKATNMNTELELHGRLIEHIDNRTDATTAHVKKANAQLKGILS